MTLNRNNAPARISTLKTAVLALLTALVVILQLLGSFIRFGPFSVTLVLVPIVIGAALCGPTAGAWLGAVFGAVVLFCGDAAPFMEFNAFGTIVTVLAKGILAGLCAGLAYRLLQRVNPRIAVITAALVCPIVNTSVFLLLCTVFFLPLLQSWATGYANVFTYMVVILVGFNFLFELLFNLVLAPVILRLLRISKITFSDMK